MKNNILTFISICFFLVSCNNTETSKKKDAKTEVIEVFENQDAVNEYFASFDMFMEEYVSMVENLAITGKSIENKGGEVDMGDLMNMLSTSTSSLMKMAPLLERMEELEKEADVLKGDMNDKELDAFMKSYLKLMTRFTGMSQKLADIMCKTKEFTLKAIGGGEAEVSQITSLAVESSRLTHRPIFFR